MWIKSVTLHLQVDYTRGLCAIHPLVGSRLEKEIEKELQVENIIFIMLARAYKIETNRLIIRCYDPKDAKLLKKSIDESLEHLLAWMPWAINEPESIQIKRERLRKFRGQFDLGLDYNFGVFSKDEKISLGQLDSTPDWVIMQEKSAIG